MHLWKGKGLHEKALAYLLTTAQKDKKHYKFLIQYLKQILEHSLDVVLLYSGHVLKYDLDKGLSVTYSLLLYRYFLDFSIA